MPTVHTRLYSDVQSAEGIRARLYREGFPAYLLKVIPGGGDLKAAQEMMLRWQVPEKTAKSYISKMKTGASLVIVRADYRPLMANQIARETFRTSGALDIGLDQEEFAVKAPLDHAPSILKDHPRFLTQAPKQDAPRELVSERLGYRLLSAPSPRHSVNDGKRVLGGRVKTDRRANSVLAGAPYMSQKFWPMRLLSDRKPGTSVIEGGGHPFSRLLGWPTAKR